MLADVNLPTTEFGVISTGLNDPRAEYFIRGGYRYMGIRLERRPNPNTVITHAGYRHPVLVHHSVVGQVVWLANPVHERNEWTIMYWPETWETRARRTWNVVN